MQPGAAPGQGQGQAASKQQRAAAPAPQQTWSTDAEQGVAENVAGGLVTTPSIEARPGASCAVAMTLPPERAVAGR